MIEIQSLTKSYDDFQAVDNISLNVEQGEIFGVIGKSGAGKSTLIRCVNLLEKPSSGKIIIDNIVLNDLSNSELRQSRRKIGMIFQHFNLLSSRTAFDNIALPLELAGFSKDKIKETVLPLLELVELSDRAQHYPHELSGGQKQRVAIARALALNPKVLLCDEATSALDPESTITILNLLKKINRELNLTILLITHEMDVIKQICDRVAVLDKGRLIEQGDVIDIFTSPKEKVTRRLTRASLHLELPKNLMAKLKKEASPGLYPILRISFINRAATQPIMTALYEKFQVTTNILQADLEYIHEATLGFTICELSGERDNIQKAIDHLHSLDIQTEVLGYA